MNSNAGGVDTAAPTADTCAATGAVSSELPAGTAAAAMAEGEAVASNAAYTTAENTPTPPHALNGKALFDLVVRLGEVVMVNGGEVQRAEDTMARAAATYGIDQFSSFVLANGIFASAVVAGDAYSCKIVYLPIATPCLRRVDAVNQLSREIAQGRCAAAQAAQRLDAIRTMPGTSPWGRVLFSGLGCAGFCYLFGGSFADSALSFGAGVLGCLYLLLVAGRLKMPKIIATISASMLVTAYALLVYAAGLGSSLDNIVIGAIYAFVPGVSFTGGIRYLCDDDYLAGITQLLDALLVGGSIAIGVGLTLTAGSWLLGPVTRAAAGAAQLALAPQLAVELGVAFLATLAFSALFSAPRRHFVFCGLTGTVSWGVYRGCLLLGASTVAAVFVSALVLSVVSRLLSARLRAPTTIFLLSGIFTLVPGAGIYYMASYLFGNDLAATAAKGAEILKIALAITLGIILAFALPPVLFGWGRDTTAYDGRSRRAARRLRGRKPPPDGG